MPTGHPLIIFGADRPLFAIGPGDTFTIPTQVPAPSPTAPSIPAPLSGSFNNLRDGVGGQTLLTVTDGLAPATRAVEFETELFPGDTITASAVVGGVVTYTRTPFGQSVGTIIATIANVTNFAALIGLYG